jgi:uncharacterized protein
MRYCLEGVGGEPSVCYGFHMIYLIVSGTAFIASVLTFFSGFGLGTILTPVFAVFFAVPIAVALTAVVHLVNNLLKLVLVGRHAHWKTVLRFGIAAGVGAWLGGLLLVYLSGFPPIGSWQLGTYRFFFMPIKLVIASLMISFTLIDVIPALEGFTFPSKYMPLGGLLSGFFGGLSGHQGALRSAFLSRSGLEKKSFIATGVVIACVVDFVRLATYFTSLNLSVLAGTRNLLLSAIVAATCGTLLGTLLLNKVTMRFIQLAVSVGLTLLALALALGII